MRLFILIILLIGLYGLWRYFQKNKLNFVIKNPQFDLKKLIQPLTKEKTKAMDSPGIVEVSEEDIRRFDDVSKLLFEKSIQKKELKGAEKIQFEFLNKMPTQTQSQIHQFDLGEWSIFWGFQGQSLEYYVSRYGVFYTHVDALGNEHKRELIDTTF